MSCHDYLLRGAPIFKMCQDYLVRGVTLTYYEVPQFLLRLQPVNLTGFMKELDSVRRLAVDNNESANPGPVVVQCASGCGRTGVLILTELMVQCLERNQVSGGFTPTTALYVLIVLYILPDFLIIAQFLQTLILIGLSVI